jgi:hypothetical protein
MLRFSDSRNFSRTLAGIGLIAGPALFVIASLLDPAWDSDHAVYLQEVADGEGRYAVSGVLWTLGSLLFIAGTLGLIKLLRGRGVSLGQVGAGLITVGLIGLTAVLAFNAFDIAMADAENREAMVELSESLEDSALLMGYFFAFFLGGIVLGSILLAIALFRRRVVPIWSPILLLVSIVVGFFAEASVLSAISFAVLLAALAPLAMRILALTDADWERWEPLAEPQVNGPSPAGPRGDGPSSAGAPGGPTPP